ncbi:hypothetical protein ABPG72_016697 [Tetrahymena utriculariae]
MLIKLINLILKAKKTQQNMPNILNLNKNLLKSENSYLFYFKNFTSTSKKKKVFSQKIKYFNQRRKYKNKYQKSNRQQTHDLEKAFKANISKQKEKNKLNINVYFLFQKMSQKYFKDLRIIKIKKQKLNAILERGRASISLKEIQNFNKRNIRALMNR